MHEPARILPAHVATDQPRTGEATVDLRRARDGSMTLDLIVILLIAAVMIEPVANRWL
jgi:hypothetical protein